MYIPRRTNRMQFTIIISTWYSSIIRVDLVAVPCFHACVRGIKLLLFPFSGLQNYFLPAKIVSFFNNYDDVSASEIDNILQMVHNVKWNHSRQLLSFHKNKNKTFWLYVFVRMEKNIFWMIHECWLILFANYAVLVLTYTYITLKQSSCNAVSTFVASYTDVFVVKDKDSWNLTVRITNWQKLLPQLKGILIIVQRTCCQLPQETGMCNKTFQEKLRQYLISGSDKTLS